MLRVTMTTTSGLGQMHDDLSASPESRFSAAADTTGPHGQSGEGSVRATNYEYSIASSAPRGGALPADAVAG
ncbi:hypothetical protein GCM10017771_37560 [Streptomyces capitiformicae]|uniref:Uncharacterized protein n=1 Tax=Streptomyces capitiformicae TaxID=2014920 RepID=A0A919GQW1_9ACTN|nr:hypothetical protein GCM10017771_37560 [Streptomyces capitiformicae]